MNVVGENTEIEAPEVEVDDAHAVSVTFGECCQAEKFGGFGSIPDRARLGVEEYTEE